MAILDIQINGRTHQIACDDGQESHVRALAKTIDAQVRDLSARMAGQATEATLLVLTALMLTDELNEMKDINQKLKLQMGNSSQAFEQAKQHELDMAVASAIDEIADDIERITLSLENA